MATICGIVGQKKEYSFFINYLRTNLDSYHMAEFSNESVLRSAEIKSAHQIPR